MSTIPTGRLSMIQLALLLILLTNSPVSLPHIKLAQSSGTIVFDCPYSEESVLNKKTLIEKCHIIPAFIVGLHWVAVPLYTMEHCLKKDQKSGEPAGLCLVSLNGVHELHLVVARSWHDEPNSTIIDPVKNVRTGFPIRRKDLQLALLEIHKLHHHLGYEQAHRIAPIQFNQSLPDEGVLLSTNILTKELDFFTASYPVQIEEQDFFDEKILGRIEHPKNMGKVGRLNAVFARAGTLFQKVPHSAEHPFFYPEISRPVRKALYNHYRLLGQVAYKGTSETSKYFARIEFNKALFNRVLRPWKWTHFEGEELPPGSVNLLKSVSSTPAPEPIYACKDSDHNLGTVEMIGHRKICRFISRQSHVEMTRQFSVLTGPSDSTLHWLPWIEFIPTANKANCNEKLVNTEEGSPRLYMNPYGLPAGFTRFGDQRLSGAIDPYVGMLCKVSEDGTHYIGRRYELDDSCIFITLGNEIGAVELKPKASVLFEVVSYEQ